MTLVALFYEIALLFDIKNMFENNEKKMGGQTH